MAKTRRLLRCCDCGDVWNSHKGTRKRWRLDHEREHEWVFPPMPERWSPEWEAQWRAFIESHLEGWYG